jgi:transcriptional regulator with XRE-family HTH domain
MTAADLIRDARRRHRIDQRTLAHRARTSQAQISRIEQGETSPGVDTLQRLLECMGERLVLSAEPLPHGNQSDADLRAELRATSPAERVRHAARLSHSLTAIAAARER